MHPPYSTTDEATHIFIFKSLFKLILTKRNLHLLCQQYFWRMFFIKVHFNCSHNLKYFFVVNNLFCNCSHNLKPHLVLPRVVYALQTPQVNCIGPGDRLEICRDRWDRRSCKIFPNCVKFWGNNANSLGNYRVIYALNQ